MSQKRRNFSALFKLETVLGGLAEVLRRIPAHARGSTAKLKFEETGSPSEGASQNGRTRYALINQLPLTALECRR
jgi:hypothetical protein